MLSAICPHFPMPDVTSLPPLLCTRSMIKFTAFSYPSVTGMLRIASLSAARISIIVCLMSMLTTFSVCKDTATMVKKQRLQRFLGKNWFANYFVEGGMWSEDGFHAFLLFAEIFFIILWQLKILYYLCNVIVSDS